MNDVYKPPDDKDEPEHLEYPEVTMDQVYPELADIEPDSEISMPPEPEQGVIKKEKIIPEGEGDSIFCKTLNHLRGVYPKGQTININSSGLNPPVVFLVLPLPPVPRDWCFRVTKLTTKFTIYTDAAAIAGYDFNVGVIADRIPLFYELYNGRRVVNSYLINSNIQDLNYYISNNHIPSLFFNVSYTGGGVNSWMSMSTTMHGDLIRAPQRMGWGDAIAPANNLADWNELLNNKYRTW